MKTLDFLTEDELESLLLCIGESLEQLGYAVRVVVTEFTEESMAIVIETLDNSETD